MLLFLTRICFPPPQHPDDTDVLADYERCQFLDLSKPLLIQVWNSNFSKEYYLEQVHQPRHLNYSAQLFSYPFLEVRLCPSLER